MNNLEAKKALAKKLDIDYSDIANNGRFSDDDLQTWLNLSGLRVWDYKPFDFTEWSKTGTLAAGDITAGYVDYPTDFVIGSISIFRINGKRQRKIRYQDFLNYFEDNANGKKCICSEYRNYIFFNTNLAVAGNVFDVYGKKLYTPLVNDADLLPFSPENDNNEYSGNEALVLLAYSEALGSQKMNNPQQAAIEEKRAYAILDVLWAAFAQNRALDQSNNAPMFDVPDFFHQTRNGSGSPIGGFNN